MIKKKCPSCAKKSEKSFSFCPHCGFSFKKQKEEDDFGMLGRDDTIQNINQQVKIPMGLNGLDKIMNSLIGQLEKQLRENNGDGIPRGFKIQISAGQPRMAPQKKTAEIKMPEITEEEIYRRRALPKQEADSKIRRLSDRVVYEIKVPGVNSKKDIIITRLEDSIEIKAYSKDKCYYKTLPIKMKLAGYYLEDDKLFLELKD